MILCLSAQSALAASGNPSRDEADEWRFTVAFPMLWMPDIDGRVRGDRSYDFNVGFDDILEGLDFGLMGEVYATRGPFGAAFRFNYMDLSGGSTSEGILVTTDVDARVRAGVNDLLASWQVHEKVRILTGLRHVYSTVDLDVTSRTGGGAVLFDESIRVPDEHAYDLLIGLSFDHWFSDRWGIMVNGDIGVVGDNDRDYSAEFRALYRFGSLNNLWFGYRHLVIGNDTQENGERFSVDMTQSGPMLGWAFTF